MVVFPPVSRRVPVSGRSDRMKTLLESGQAGCDLPKLANGVTVRAHVSFLAAEFFTTEAINGNLLTALGSAHRVH